MTLRARASRGRSRHGLDVISESTVCPGGTVLDLRRSRLALTTEVEKHPTAEDTAAERASLGGRLCHTWRKAGDRLTRARDLVLDDRIARRGNSHAIVTRDRMVPGCLDYRR